MSKVAPAATETSFDELNADALPSVTVPAFTATLPTKAVLVVMVSDKTDVELIWITWVTFAPNLLLIVAVPAPVPELVMVPVLLTKVVSKNVLLTVPVLFRTISPVPVTPPLSFTEPVPLAVRVRLLLSVTAPLNTALLFPELPMVRVPELPEATVIRLANVRVSPSSVALALPLVSPNVTVPEPSAFAFVVALTVPALIVTPPLNVLLLLRVSVPAPVFVRLMLEPEITPLITNVPPPP